MDWGRGLRENRAKAYRKRWLYRVLGVLALATASAWAFVAVAGSDTELWLAWASVIVFGILGLEFLYFGSGAPPAPPDNSRPQTAWPEGAYPTKDV